MRASLTAVILLAVLGGPVAAQAGIVTNPRTAEMTREELRRVEEQLQNAAASPGYSEKLRQQARREAEFIRERLERGDFQVGDRIVLRLQGAMSVTDTLSVQAGRVITLDEIGEIPLQGVLRSELQDYLENELSRYVQNPVVRAQSLIRIAVLGEVSVQGFYTIPANALIEDVFMVAGGPGPEADINEAEIRRGDQVVLGGEGLQQAIIEGRTLDQLNLRAGDRVIVPREPRGLFSEGVVRGLVTVVPTLILLFQFL